MIACRGFGNALGQLCLVAPVAAGLTAGVTAGVTSAAPRTPSELTGFATRYAAAWSGQDPAKLASFYAENGTLQVNASDPSVGRGAVAATAAGFMAAFPDMVVTLDAVSGKGRHATFHWTWTGTNSGPGGTGHAVRMKGYEEWTFNDDGLLVESKGHCDEAEYERQLAGGLGDPGAAIEFLNSGKVLPTALPFSEAVRVGRTLYLSGQIGIVPGTLELVPGGLKDEARQTLENIKTTLEAHGYALADVVKCTVMLADIAEWRVFNEVYATFFAKPHPARSALGASGLALGARVEVECIAARE